MDSWPLAIHQKIRGLGKDKIGEFVLKAITRPM
jgi:hypothetical protein